MKLSGIFPGQSEAGDPSADMKSFRIQAKTGNPVEVFFPGAGKAIAVYENGYVPIFLDEGRAGDWLATDMFWDMRKRRPAAMLRVRFWKAGVCEERLFVESYGGVGDVREEFIASQSAVQIGPVRVVSTSHDYDMNRVLLIFHWERQELMLAGQAVAFCQDDQSFDLAVVYGDYAHIKKWWLQIVGEGIERRRLPAEGKVELAWDMGAILQPSGAVLLARASQNVARLVAHEAWIAGLSPDGNWLVTIQRKPDKGWVWDFRQTSEPQNPVHELPGPSRAEMGISDISVARISPDLRWAVAADEFGHVVAWRVPDVGIQAS
jgi:hypothetical protein